MYCFTPECCEEIEELKKSNIHVGQMKTLVEAATERERQRTAEEAAQERDKVAKEAARYGCVFGGGESCMWV